MKKRILSIIIALIILVISPVNVFGATENCVKLSIVNESGSLYRIDLQVSGNDIGSLITALFVVDSKVFSIAKKSGDVYTNDISNDTSLTSSIPNNCLTINETIENEDGDPAWLKNTSGWALNSNGNYYLKFEPNTSLYKTYSDYTTIMSLYVLLKDGATVKSDSIRWATISEANSYGISRIVGISNSTQYFEFFNNSEKDTLPKENISISGTVNGITITGTSTPTTTPLATPTTLAWDTSSGTTIDATWDAVTNAGSYSVSLYKDSGTEPVATKTVSDSTSCDFSAAIKALTDKNGTYRFTVTAVPKTNETATYGNSAPATSGDLTVPVKLATPAGLTWERTSPYQISSNATWDAVPGAASYSVSLYKDVYKDNGRTLVEIVPVTVEDGTSYKFTTLNVSDTAPGNYTFKVTAIAASGGLYADSTEADSAPNTDGTHTINPEVTLNGASGKINGVANLTYPTAYGQPLTNLSQSYFPTRTGYTFKGFYSDTTTSAIQYFDADGTVKVTTDITEDITLYAQWTADTYAVTYKSLAHLTASGPDKATYGQDYTFKLTADPGYYPPEGTTNPSITIGGVKFEGYTYSITGNVGTVTITASAVTGAIEVTASADIIEYNITYKIGNDAYTPEGTYNKAYDITDDSIILPPAPTKSGYTFTGWMVTAVATNHKGFELFDIITGATHTIANAYGDVQLTAQWKEILPTPTGLV